MRKRYNGIYRYRRNIWAIRYTRWKRRHPGGGFVSAKWWARAIEEMESRAHHPMVICGEIGRIEKVRFITI